MKDFFGKECQIGDTVAFNEPHYKGLVSGQIVKFTPKGVRVKYFLHGNPNYWEKDTFVYEGDFVKAEGQNAET